MLVILLFQIIGASDANMLTNKAIVNSIHDNISAFQTKDKIRPTLLRLITPTITFNQESEDQWKIVSQLFPQMNFVSIDCSKYSLICLKYTSDIETPYYVIISPGEKNYKIDTIFENNYSSLKSTPKLIETINKFTNLYPLSLPAFILTPYNSNDFYKNSSNPIFVFYCSNNTEHDNFLNSWLKATNDYYFKKNILNIGFLDCSLYKSECSRWSHLNNFTAPFTLIYSSKFNNFDVLDSYSIQSQKKIDHFISKQKYQTNKRSAKETSGYCGDDVLYQIDLTQKKLTIYGNGKMDNFSMSGSPWYSYSKEIRHVIINDGVTSIGDCAFQSLWESKTDMTVTIPETVTYIGIRSFSSSYFNSIKIPESVNYIAERAFYQCIYLTSINIPHGITEISDGLFHICSSLSSITIPDSVTSIGYQGFSGCSFTSFVMPETITQIVDYCFRGCSYLKSISLSPNIKKIPSFAFEESGLEFVAIHDNITSIEFNSFNQCKKLTSVIIGKNVNLINFDAFSKCNSLVSITYLGLNCPKYYSYTFTDSNQLSKIFVTNEYKNNTFCGFNATVSRVINSSSCGKNVYWVYNEFDHNLTIYGNGYMDDYTSSSDVPWSLFISSIEFIRIDVGVKSIGARAFEDALNVEKINISETVSFIGTKAFFGCSKIKTIGVSENNSYLISINNVLYSKDETTLVLYPSGKEETYFILHNSTTFIQDYAFYNCTNLISIYFTGQNEPSFGTEVFEGCEKLTTIYVPTNYISNTFNGITIDKILITGDCGQNIHWILNQNTNTINIYGKYDISNYSEFTKPSYYSYSSMIFHIIVENGVTSIGKYAFSDLQNLKSIYLHPSIVLIENYAMINCSNLETIEVHQDNNQFKSMNNILFSKNGTTLIYFPNTKNISLYQIPDDVEIIGDCAFYGHQYLKSVNFNNVKKIGKYAFEYCKMETILFMSRIEIDENSFANNAYLKVVTIDDYILIRSFAFANCTQLYLFSFVSEDFFCNGVDIFFNCISLKCLHLSPKTSGYSQICGIPASVQYTIYSNYSNNAKYFISTLENVMVIFGSGQILENKENYPSYYDYKSNIKTVIIENGFTTISSSAFIDFPYMESLIIPETVNIIERDAFDKLVSLKSIEISINNKNYTSIDNVIFTKNETNLIYYPEGKSDLYYIIPKNAKCIERNGIYGAMMKTILFDSSIDITGISSCQLLENVIYLGKTTSINIDNIFSNCSKIKSIHVTADYEQEDFFQFPIEKCIEIGKISSDLNWILDNISRSLYIIGSDIITQDDAQSIFSIDRYNSLIKEINIDASRIGENSFVNLNNVNLIYLSKNIKTIEEGAISRCLQLKSILVSSSNNYMKSIDGILYSKNDELLIRWPADKNITSYVIPTNLTTTINSYAFCNCKNLKKIIFPHSLQHIESFAFSESSLEFIRFMDNITSLGKSAFYNCTHLKTIIYRGISIPSIEYQVFEGTFNVNVLSYQNCNDNYFSKFLIVKELKSGMCGKELYWDLGLNTLFIYGNGDLTTDRLPEWYSGSSVTKIIIESNTRKISFDEIFVNLENVEYIFLPKSISIEGISFLAHLSSLQTIEIDENNDQLTIIDNVLYSKDGTELLYYLRNKNETTFIFPENVTSVGYRAFYRSSYLKNVIVNNKTTTIGDLAFESSSISFIYMPSSVNNISSSFKICNFLLTVIILSTNFKYISSTVFTSCSRLSYIEMPINYNETIFGGKDVKRCIAFGECNTDVNWILNIETGILNIYGKSDINNYTHNSNRPWYSYDSYIKTVNIRNGIKSIGDYSFSNLRSLVKINIPNSVVWIGQGAFSLCTQLTTLNINENNTQYTLLDNVLYSKDKSVLILYPSTKNNSIFTIPDNVTTIGNYAFSNCINIEKIVFNNQLKYVNDYAFYSCNFKSIVIPENIISFGKSVFKDCINLEFVFYTGMYEPNIEDNIFIGCNKLNSVQVKVDYVNETFSSLKAEKYIANGDCGCNLSWVLNISSGILNITGNGDMINYTENSEFPWDSYSSYIRILYLNNGIQSIGDFAFISLSNLETVYIPKSLERIGSFAFSLCHNLREFEVDVSNLNFIAFDNVLYSYNKKQLILYPLGLTETNYSVLNDVEYIIDYAFSGCESLISIELPNKLRSIGDHAFSNCSILESIIIPNMVTSIGSYAFSNCSSLKYVNFGTRLQSIGDYSFSNCVNLSFVLYNGTYQPNNFGNYVFSGCPLLKSINVLNYYANEKFGDLPIEKDVIIESSSENENIETTINSESSELNENQNTDSSEETVDFGQNSDFSGETVDFDQSTDSFGESVDSSQNLYSSVVIVDSSQKSYISDETDDEDQSIQTSDESNDIIQNSESFDITISTEINIPSQVVSEIPSSIENSATEVPSNENITAQPPSEIVVNITISENVNDEQLDDILNKEFSKLDSNNNTNKVLVYDTSYISFNSNLTNDQYIKPNGDDSKIKYNGGNLNIVLPDTGKVTITLKDDEAKISIKGEGEMILSHSDTNSKSISLTGNSKINGSVKITIQDETDNVLIDSIELENNGTFKVESQNNKYINLNVKNISTTPNSNATIANMTILDTINIVQSSIINVDNITFDIAKVTIDIFDFDYQSNNWKPFVKGNFNNPPNNLILNKVTNNKENNPELEKEYILITGLFENKLCENWLQKIDYGNTGFNSKNCLDNTGLLSFENQRIILKAEKENNKNNKLSGGQIAGIVIGCIAGVAIIVVIVIVFIRHKNKNRNSESEDNENSNNDDIL